MKSGFDQHSEHLIKSAEKLLKEVEGLSDLKKILAHDLDKPETARNEGAEGAGRIEETESADGRVDIFVAEDGMKALASLYPARGEGKMPDMDLLRRRLEEEGVVYGMDWDLAEEAVLQCTTGKKHIVDVPLAAGKAPKDEVAEYFEILPCFLEAETTSEKNEAAAGASYPFPHVNKGEVLARVVPAETGEDGVTVRGETLPRKILKRSEIEPGTNTEKTEDTVIAAKDGRFVLRGSRFSIQEVLDVKGDVDASTGNVHFNGEVLVRGTIREGQSVEAGGSVYCSKDVELTLLCAGKDLVVEGGIIGKKKALAKAGGEVRARSIEHSVIEARGSVRAERSITQCLVRTHAAVFLGKKGAILGGKTSAKDGITAAQLGSDKGTKTEIQVGIDPETFRKILWLKNKTGEMKAKIDEIEASLAAGQDNPELRSLKDQMEKQLVLVEKTSLDLETKIEKNEKAEIKVSGYVFPGVVLEICRAPFEVREILKNVRFYLDATAKAVKTSPLI